MILRQVLVLCCAALLLAFSWVPLAFIAIDGLDGARERMRSLLDFDYGEASVLPASRIDAVFLDLGMIPVPKPELPDLYGSRPSPGGHRSWRLPEALSVRPYARLVEQAAERHGVDPRLVHALIEVESGYRADAVSGAGAMGLMQLMPRTAAHYGLADPLDPAANIDAGTRYLRALLDEFGPLFALAAYHTGESVIRRYGGVPPHPQTQRYVRRVMNALLSQTGVSGGD